MGNTINKNKHVENDKNDNNVTRKINNDKNDKQQ